MTSVPTPPDPDATFDPLRDRLFVADAVRTLEDGVPAGAVEGDAVAVRGGRILGVGAAADLAPRLADGFERVELPGATLTPGFHDAHVHLGYHGLERAQVPLGDTTSFDAAIARLAERAAALPPGTWVEGAGFALQRWGVRRPDRAPLDAALPDHPVLMRSQDHHGALANAAALAAAGVDAATPDPPGGEVVRRADGTPTGELLERAVELVAGAVPAPSDAALAAALYDGARHLASLGVTTVHHMAYEPARNHRAIAREASRATFPLRVWACLMQEDLEAAEALGVATGQGGDRYEVGGAKFFVDGALGSLTAWMEAPYLGHDDAGRVVTDPAVLHERVGRAVAAGLTPVGHAIGDAAVAALLDAFEAHAPAWRAAGLRPRVEHAQHVAPRDVVRLGRLGLVASMQPLHLTFDAPTIHRELADRIDRAYPVRSLAEAGATVAFGSDTPVAPPDVVATLRAATERRGLNDLVVGPDEALTPLAAVRAYTRGAAAAIGREGTSGVLRPGADADLTAWSHDPTAGAYDDLRALATVVAGRVAYRA
ncbi:MAG: amidohydrolase [Trueperaceae bacterium]|nr:amidohydrolase [Trueperaceae bacterium]